MSIILSRDQASAKRTLLDMIHGAHISARKPRKAAERKVIVIQADQATWLWRNGKPYRKTASGICFSYKGVKKNDS